MNTKPTQKSKAVRNAEIEKQAMQDARHPAFLPEILEKILSSNNVNEMRHLTARAACAFGAGGNQYVLNGLFSFISQLNKCADDRTHQKATAKRKQ